MNLVDAIVLAALALFAMTGIAISIGAFGNCHVTKNTTPKSRYGLVDRVVICQ